MPGTRPNVLWIFCDELRTDALTCYGERSIGLPTPHIDALAAQGMRFARCFCNSPVCVPSRVSMLTATHPEETGVYGNEAAWKSYLLDRAFPTFPERFAAAGYRTASLGKTHLPRAMRPFAEHDGRGAGMLEFFAKGVPREQMDLVLVPSGGVLAGCWPDEVEYPGAALTRNALDWLRDAARGPRPFLLRVAYLQPHTPVIAPASLARRNGAEPWPGAPDLDRDQSTFERLFGELSRVAEIPPASLRRIHGDYFALAAWIDREVGRLLEGLEACGLRERTIVVFDTDHGANLGEGGCFAKHIFAPRSHRIPRILCGPGIPRGELRSDLCQGLDLARTLCALCDVEPASVFRGRDLLREPAPDAVFATIGYGEPHSRVQPNRDRGAWTDGGGWPRRACIRTARYRLDLCVRRNGRPVPPEQEDAFLADASLDPDERRNRVHDPELRGVVAELRMRLLDHVACAHEPPLVPRFSPAEVGIELG